MVQIDMDKPVRCIDCPLCVDYDCIIQTRLLRENYTDLREQYKNCPLIPEAVTGCHDCPEYDTEHHYCEKFCRVIRNTVEELRGQNGSEN